MPKKEQNNNRKVTLHLPRIIQFCNHTMIKHDDIFHSVETNIYFGTNRILNIIRLMKIERIEYRILFAHQENIRILFEYLKIFEYSNIFE